MTNEYMTVQEVSEYLKIPEETIYKYARTSRIPAAKLGRHWRFERSQIDAWFARSLGDSAPVEVPRETVPLHRLRVLIVDDERAIAKLLQRWLQDDGHEVECAGDGAEALHVLGDARFDLVFLDLCMPNMDGVAFLEALKATDPPHPQVVVMTGYADSPLMDQALDYDIRYSLDKPMDHEAVSRLVTSITDHLRPS